MDLLFGVCHAICYVINNDHEHVIKQMWFSCHSAVVSLERPEKADSSWI